jgi:plastocyanin
VRSRTLALASLGLLLGACGGGSAGDEGPSIAPDCTDVSGNASSSVELVDYAFHPGCLIVGADEPLTLTNTGEAVHTFTIDDRGVDLELGPGDTRTVRDGLRLDPGVYQLRCTLHPQMLGTIEVR